MEHILTETKDGILRIEINRPDKKNALTAAMYQAMADALKAAETDAKVRVVLIQGKTDLFTSGQRPAGLSRQPAAGRQPAGVPVPVRHQPGAKADRRRGGGAAVGIGTTMLLHCDLVYAAPNARLQLPFVNLGLVPEAASSLLLPALIGYQRAAELCCWASRSRRRKPGKSAW